MKREQAVKTWIEPELDFEELYHAGKYQKLIRLSIENQNLIKKLYKKVDKTNLKTSVRFGTLLLSYLERTIEKVDSLYAVYMMGKLKGRLEFIDEESFEEQQNQIVEMKARYAGTKYLEGIVKELEIYGVMRQMDLAEKLGLQKSTFSEALKKIRDTQLVQVQMYGKYKMYSLTDDGIRYATLIRKNKHKKPGLEETLAALQNYLCDEETKQEMLDSLKMMLENDGTIRIKAGEIINLLETDKKENRAKKFKVEQIMSMTNEGRTQSIIIGSESKTESVYSILNSNEAV